MTEAVRQASAKELFFDQIRSKSLLTPEQEKELTLTYRAGRLLVEQQEVSSSCLITALARVLDTPIAQAWFEVTGVLDLADVDAALTRLGQAWSNAQKPDEGNNPYLKAVSEVSNKAQVEKKQAEEASLDIVAASGILLGLSSQEEDFGPYFQTIIEQGQIARSHLEESNLRMVVDVAGKYQNKGIDILDLVQESYLYGLRSAVRKFNPYRAGKFSTYATNWLKQGVKRGMLKFDSSIVPIYLRENTEALRTLATRLSIELGRTASVAEVAAKAGKTEERVRHLLETDALQVVSLEAPPPGYDYSPVYDSIADEGANIEEEVLEGLRQEDLRREVDLLLDSLPQQDRIIVRMRFGIGYKRPCIYEEIGKEFGITHQAVEQRFKKAMGKVTVLAQNGHKEKLESLL